MTIFVWKKKMDWPCIMITFKRVLKYHTDSVSKYLLITMCYSVVFRPVFEINQEPRARNLLFFLHNMQKWEVLSLVQTFSSNFIIDSTLSLVYFYLNSVYKIFFLQFDLGSFFVFGERKILLQYITGVKNVQIIFLWSVTSS